MSKDLLLPEFEPGTSATQAMTYPLDYGEGLGTELIIIIIVYMMTDVLIKNINIQSILY